MTRQKCRVWGARKASVGESVRIHSWVFAPKRDIKDEEMCFIYFRFCLYERYKSFLASVFAPKMETKGKEIISCFYSEIMLYHFIHKYDAWATQKVLSRKQKCIFFSFEVVTLYPLFEHLNHSSWYHLSCFQFVVSHRSVSPKHLLNMDGS